MQSVVEKTDGSPGNDTCPDRPEFVPLYWWNVGLASLFILNNIFISIWLGLKLEKTLLISAIRCVVQLTVMGMVLDDVFGTKNPVLIMGLVFVLIFLGANEIVFNKSKKRYSGMWVTVLLALGASTLTIGTIGTRFAMGETPFWEPQKFIPTMGMLIGNCMSGIAVAVSYCLSQLSEQKEKIETYLVFGASRWEAGRPTAIEAIRLAMLPTINNMSVIGLITIPGMMTGQIIGGAPIMDAVKYQQIIMFMLTASTALGVVTAVGVCIFTCIDGSHRLRSDRITDEKPWLYRKWGELLGTIERSLLKIGTVLCCCFAPPTNKPNSQNGESQVLLGNGNLH